MTPNSSLRPTRYGGPSPCADELAHWATTPSLSRLQAEVEDTDAWYVDYVARTSEPALSEVLAFTFTDGDAGRMTREEILLHVITHGGYHRGNVGELLKTISVPPTGDLYTKFLHASEPERRGA